MNKQAHVSFILDQSGSMSSVWDATISGFNEYVHTLQGDKDVDYTFDLTLFNSSVTRRTTNANLKSLEPLTKSTYNPSGSTALYDAVCETLLAHESRGSKWIVVIMTDGEENCSQKYNKNQLADFVKLLQNTGVVTFVFMGANQDAWQTAKQWNMHQGNTMTYTSDTAGTHRAFYAASMGTSMTAQSAANQSVNFFQADSPTQKTDLQWQADQTGLSNQVQKNIGKLNDIDQASAGK